METLSTSTALEQFIVEQRQQQDILLMSHTVLGYPSFHDNYRAVDALVQAGVELIELQFPFLEAIADGSILLNANHSAIQAGTTINDCFCFAAKITRQYWQARFVVTTYCNVVYQYGVEQFVQTVARSGIAGLIIPDLPPEEAETYVAACNYHGIATIFLCTPNSCPQRLQQIAKSTSGMIYCTARKGVTGHETQFSTQFNRYVESVRAFVQRPIGVGFGIQSQAAISQLKGQIDIAIIGTQAVKLYVEQGASALEGFMRDLRNGKAL
ncbi:tryptophan synthase subunit alpha [Leptolyngbya sp. FACHB-711]|uniref:tryptophan synthase subunit alpha n=1 Tax=unclassified Leptolyngbya TaxID=2650499 RepID=UPI001686D798|nr:tryptophan synthase subunit alpha [Leptolyngbya sp. FACHB-711]MBD1852306.1 tryptophan synthase subunit alpha [Cyanobacteria bacterium FACHB-502]MBD2024497.1 tryptophan synthase subunit alpha [Leptolyngbya sp. FACHB-711]